MHAGISRHPSLYSPLTAIGILVALGGLFIGKLHSETFGRFSDALLRSAALQATVAKFPLAWSLTGLALLIGGLVACQTHAIPPPPAIGGLLFGVVWLDVGLVEIGRFPESIAQIKTRCNRTWVRYLVTELRDGSQIALTRHIVDLVVLTGAVSVALVMFAAARLSGWGLLLPALLIYVRTNGLWQEIVHIDSHMRFMTPARDGRSMPRRFALRAVSWLSDWMLSQYFGMFPGWYRVEHVGNHHPEINSLEDVETLQNYDRTSFLQFGVLTGRLIANTTVGYGMYGYLLKKRRLRLLKMALGGVSVRVVTIVGSLIFVAPLGAWLIISSLAFGHSLAMIAVADHGLTDPADPTDIYRNSYNVRWDLDDHGQYGSRYHLSHHLMPAPTWGRRMQAAARRHEAGECRARGAIIFHSLAYPDDFLRAYWSDDADYLYAYVLCVGRDRPTLPQWRDLFATRIRPIGMKRPGTFERLLSRAAAKLVVAHIPPPSHPAS